MTVTLGIDPGLSGAIGVLKDGEYVAVLDIPTVMKGTGVVSREVDPANFYKMLFGVISAPEGTELALERVSAMPGQGSSSVFSFGDTYGCCRSVAAISGVATYLVAPAVWKRHFKLSKDKEEARALAIRLFPDAPLGLKKYIDRAEALLISRWLWETRHK